MLLQAWGKVLCTLDLHKWQFSTISDKYEEEEMVVTVWAWCKRCNLSPTIVHQEIRRGGRTWEV